MTRINNGDIGEYVGELGEQMKVANASLEQKVNITDGKKTSIIAGVIRNDGTGWRFIQDLNHAQTGMDTIIEVDTENIILKYPAKKKVISFIVTPDDRLAKQGYTCGSSVEIDNAKISLQLQSVYANITNGSGSYTTTDNSGGVSVNFNDDTNVLEITHPHIKGQAVSITNRKKDLIDCRLSSPFADSNHTYVEFWKKADVSGNAKYDGTNWILTLGNNIISATWDSTKQALKINHPTILNFAKFSIIPRNNDFDICAYCDNDNIYVEFYNKSTGAKYTSPVNGMNVWISRDGVYTKTKPNLYDVNIHVLRLGSNAIGLNPSDVVWDGGNLWVMGIFEDNITYI